MSRITGKCPVCGQPTWDGNTYDDIRCMREGDRRELGDDAGNILEDQDTDRSPAANRGDDPANA